MHLETDWHKVKCLTVRVKIKLSIRRASLLRENMSKEPAFTVKTIFDWLF